MLIYNSNISVSPLTTHIPLKSVNKSISKIDINTGQPIYDTDKGDLRRKELNSKK